MNAINIIVNITLIFGPACLFLRSPKFEEKTKWIGALLLLVGGYFLMLGFYDVFGSECPGGLFEKSHYTARVYVYAYPDNDEAKNYHIPAQIEAGFEDGTNESEGSQRAYYLQRIEFPNGGYARFDDGPMVYLDGKITAFDTQHRYWGIKLTGELAK
jgi:hypothetical protein